VQALIALVADMAYLVVVEVGVLSFCQMSSLKEIQQSGKDLLALEAPKPDFSGLPDTFLCPGCKAIVYKSLCTLFIFPADSCMSYARPASASLETHP